MYIASRCSGQSLRTGSATFGTQSSVLNAMTDIADFHVVGTLWTVGEGTTEALVKSTTEHLPYNTGLHMSATCLTQDAPDLPDTLLPCVSACQSEDARALLSQTWLMLCGPMHDIVGRLLCLWFTQR